MKLKSKIILRRSSITITSAIIALSLSYSCSVPSNTSQQEAKVKVATTKNISGKAIFPNLKANINLPELAHANKLKIKATVTDVTDISTVSVIIPPDATTDTNKTVATGLTDISGSFLVDMTGVNIVTNSIYVLEASKRTNNSEVMTIRTYIRWNGTIWESITGTDILIDDKSTAVTIVAGYNTSTISSDSTIGKISSGVISDIGTTTSAIITDIAKKVNSVLIEGRDPIAYIKYNSANTPDKQYYVNPLFNYINITQKAGCSSCDLGGTDLSKVTLEGKDLSYSDLRGKDLSNVDLSNTILIGADLRGATLPNDLSYLDLSEVKLTAQDLKSGASLKNLTGTNLSYADLTGIDLSGTLGNLSDLSKTRLTGVNLTNADLQYTNLTKVHLFDAKFDNTKIANADMTNADLTAVDLSNVFNKDLTNVKMAGTNLTGANLSNLDVTKIFNKDLTGSLVSGVIMENATLSGINLANKNFFQAHLSGAIFTGTGTSDGKLLKANFRNADLSKAKLNNIDLSDLDFTNCDLSDAVLSGSRIFGTNFTGANLQGAYLNAGVNITRSKFISADMRNLKAFRGCIDVNFSYADFTGFTLTGVGLGNASFAKSATGSGCIFTKAKLNQCNFSSAGSSFSNSTMDGAEMIGSSFRGVSFINVRFDTTANGSANISDSDFNSANFTNSSITATDPENSGFESRSLTTSFVVSTWHDGFLCSNTSYGVCKDNNGNKIP